MQPGAHNVTNTSSSGVFFPVLQLVSTYIHVYYHHVLIKRSLNLIIKMENVCSTKRLFLYFVYIATINVILKPHFK